MDEKQTFASEMYEDLKKHTMFLRKIIIGLVIVIGVLVAALTARASIISTSGPSLIPL